MIKKKNKKSLLLTVILTVVMVVALAFSAYAAQSDAVSKDGLTAQLFTDKNAYEANESVAVTVRVDNQTGKEVSIVTTINVPESVKLGNESSSYEADLKAGETWTTPEVEIDDGTTGSEAETDSGTTGSEAETDDRTTGSEAETDDGTTGSEAETDSGTTDGEAETDDGAAGGDVETGDNMKAALWIVLAVLSAGTIIALLIYGKNRKTWISMLLCLIMVGGLSATAISAQAADLSGEIQLSCTIQVDGKDEVVTATVSYVIHDVDASGGETVEMSDRLEALIAHAENVLMYGRNIEGALYPQILVDGMDPVTKEPTIWNKFNSNKSYISNIYSQSNLLRMLEGLTSITGDDRYARAAYDQLQVRYDSPDLVDNNGLFYAGGHCFVDVMTGQEVGTGLYHEWKAHLLPVEMYYKVDPEGFERLVTAAWNAHIYDASNLKMNRHAEYNIPLLDFWNLEYTDTDPYILTADTTAFISTAIDMIEMAYYLSNQTGDPIYQTWGERLLDKYIAVTDEDTGLTANYYGRRYETSTGSTDDWIYNFAGAEFVDANGVDYRTLTEDDYAICGESQRLTRANVRIIQGFVVQTLMDLYEMTGQQKLYDLVKGNMVGFVRYIYDPEIHRFKTPISTNGTDFNPGGDGPVLVAPRGGTFLTAGTSFVENESVSNLILKSLIDTVHMLKDEDAAERTELWEAARAWAKNVGLGDIGTAMGENVNVNLETTLVNTEIISAVLSLYKYTGHQQYYDLAVRMGDNILQKCFNEETGLFTPYADAPYVKFSTMEMYAVFCVEAMTQGMIDEIDLEMLNKGVEHSHEGFSNRIGDGPALYERDRVEVTNVDLGSETYSLVLGQNPNLVITDVTGHVAESAIRQMVALGVMDIDTNGNFAPDATVTLAELLEMVVELFGFDNAEGLIDENLGGANFDGDKIATREEMASIIVRALKAATPETTYYVADALYRIQDADSIADWARDYADIATNYRLMVDITEDVFDPKADVTKAMVADAFQNLCRYLEVDGLHSLTATVTPSKADTQIITWETSDNTVLEVDQQGRIYPLKTGEAVITATADTKSAQVKVVVSVQEDWMIKEITLGGEKIAGFDSNTREYDVNLDLGTTQIPEITATSVSGAPVEVKLPDTLPGIVELKVQGTDVMYTINVDNTFVEYILDLDFELAFGTTIDKTATDRFIWDIRGSSARYNPYCTVIDANSVDSGREGGCLSFPYLYDLGTKNMSRILLGEEYRIEFGSQPDDVLLVIEMDIAVREMAGKTNGFDIYFTSTTDSNYFAWINITENQIRRSINGNVNEYSEESIRTIEDNRFYNLRFVVDKAGTMNYYLDGELLEKDVPFFREGATGLGRIFFDNPLEGEECKDSKAELFFDNIKVYELQRSAVEEIWPQGPEDWMIEEITLGGEKITGFDASTREYDVNLALGTTQVPEITATSVSGAPVEVKLPDTLPGIVELKVQGTDEMYTINVDNTYVEYILNQDFDLAIGTTIDKVTTDQYIWDIRGSNTRYIPYCTIVDANTVDSGREGGCLSFPYVYDLGVKNMSRILLNEEYRIDFGSEQDSILVIELDIAVRNMAGKTNGFDIYFTAATDSNYFAWLNITENEIRRSINGNPDEYSAESIQTLEDNRFYNLRFVVDKTGTMSYYLDGELLEKDVAFFMGATGFGRIFFDNPLEVGEGYKDCEAELFFDNLKIYELDRNVVEEIWP